jgi:hypothetical protein
VLRVCGQVLADRAQSGHRDLGGWHAHEAVQDVLQRILALQRRT